MKYTKSARSIQLSALLLHKHSEYLHKNRVIMQNIWSNSTILRRNITIFKRYQEHSGYMRAWLHIYVLGKASLGLLNRGQIPTLFSMNTHEHIWQSLLNFIPSRPHWMDWIGECALLFFHNVYLGSAWD